MRRYLILSNLAILAMVVLPSWVGKAGDAVSEAGWLRKAAQVAASETRIVRTDSELKESIPVGGRLLVLSSGYGRGGIRFIPFWQKSSGPYRRSFRASFLAALASRRSALVDERGAVLHRDGLQVAAGSNHITIQHRMT